MDNNNPEQVPATDSRQVALDWVAAGLSQSEAARRVGVHPSTVCSWCNWDRRKAQWRAYQNRKRQGRRAVRVRCFGGIYLKGTSDGR